MFVVLPATAIAQNQGSPACRPPERGFTDWSVPVNLGTPVNTTYLESCVTISKNGLSLFFSSVRPAGQGSRDLYVSKRDSIDSPWGDPQPLTTLNTPSWESCPALSLDEHRLYFTSPRPGGCGGQDIYVSRRHDRRDDFGWEEPENLGCEAEGGPNSVAFDLTPALFEDERGRVVLYFSSDRSANWDSYQSRMRHGAFGPATPVAELNGPYAEQGLTVRRDGLEVIFLRQTPTPYPSPDDYSMDFWVATRRSTRDLWSAAVHVPSLGTPPGTPWEGPAWAQGKISLSFDGRELYFTSWRDPSNGLADLWVARREKLRHKVKQPPAHR
jgi:hypothetical protein